VNDRGGNGAGCFDIEEWADTTELTNVKVAGLGKCSYLVGERKKMKPRLRAAVADPGGGRGAAAPHWPDQF